ASLVPTGKQKVDPIVVTVTQSGSYRVNDRELINSSPDTLRAALVEIAGADRDKPVTVRADGRATHQSVVSAMDVLGKLGFVRLNIATIEESPPAK
ncbi:MAG TPA: biopolymer transporter ExbD, partial [Steroidobacteraceae bacterium]|nr:biopolymer transporter ExbD [Steroidobacteraceae bacterium]